MKNSWIIQISQLKEWKNLILEGKGNDVVSQINDILNQIGHDGSRFNEVKTTFLMINGIGDVTYTVDAWLTDCQNEEGVVLADVTIFKNGHFEVRIRDGYECDQEVEKLVYIELEKLLKNYLTGKRILVLNTEDDDLSNWLDENKNKPLIVESVEVDSWGIWVKDCPYRIDLDEYVLA